MQRLHARRGSSLVHILSPEYSLHVCTYSQEMDTAVDVLRKQWPHVPQYVIHSGGAHRPSPPPHRNLPPIAAKCPCPRRATSCVLGRTAFGLCMTRFSLYRLVVAAPSIRQSLLQGGSAIASIIHQLPFCRGNSLVPLSAYPGYNVLIQPLSCSPSLPATDRVT